jgi:hypothetical protein
MAIRTRLEDGSGGIGDTPDIRLVEGKMTEQVALTVSGKLREVLRRINEGWSLGSGLSPYKAGNLDAQYIDVLVPGVADTEFIVPHGLQRKPVAFAVVRKDRAVDVYDSSAGSWTDTLVYLKADVANATVKLLIW